MLVLHDNLGSGNAYKVQQARTAVKRALLAAVDKLEGAL